MQVTLLDSLALFPIIILVTALPISIAGWGPREKAMIVVLGLVGVDQESALALAVLIGIIVSLTSLPGGVVWLSVRQQKA